MGGASGTAYPETLYEKLKTLKINGLNIEVGKTQEINKLLEHKFKKAGQISKLLIKKEPGQTVWWSKNCDINCFEDDFHLFPNLDTSSGAKMMYGTSSFLFFNGNIIKKVTFQLVGNDTAAKWIIDKFKDSATKVFGTPKNEGDRSIWEDNQNYIIAEMILNSPHAHFHWLSK